MSVIIGQANKFLYSWVTLWLRKSYTKTLLEILKEEKISLKEKNYKLQWQSRGRRSEIGRSLLGFLSSPSLGISSSASRSPERKHNGLSCHYLRTELDSLEIHAQKIATFLFKDNASNSKDLIKSSFFWTQRDLASCRWFGSCPSKRRVSSTNQATSSSTSLVCYRVSSSSATRDAFSSFTVWSYFINYPWAHTSSKSFWWEWAATRTWLSQWNDST